MTGELSGTKQALLIAAGELFVEHGLEGTSVRAIAEKGNANIAAINYHFGGKENLYTEVLRFVLESCVCPGAQIALGDEEWSRTQEGCARKIEELVGERFTSYFSPEQPHWYGRLVIRSTLDPTVSLETVVKQVMMPELEALRAVFQRIRPELTDSEARLWSFSLIGQIAFYVLAEAPILMSLEKETYDSAFLSAASKHVTKLMQTALGLPLTKEED